MNQEEYQELLKLLRKEMLEEIDFKKKLWPLNLNPH